MEIKRENHLLFLDIDVYRRLEGSLGRKIYRNPTHTNLYLNPGSHHKSSNIQAILSMLVCTATTLCDKESLHDELKFLKTTFKENSYGIKQKRRTLNLAVRTSKLKVKPTLVALIPYVQKTYGQLSRMLAKYIKCFGLLSRKWCSVLHPVKDGLALRNLGVYSIPCKVFRQDIPIAF
jgi:hypothetical protein